MHTGEPIPLDEVLRLPCDVLIPAAIPDVIDAETARTLQCRAVVEAANGPTTEEGDKVLRERGITVLPDIVANGGAAMFLEHVSAWQKRCAVGSRFSAFERLWNEVHRGTA